jgi:hypothetical protein
MISGRCLGGLVRILRVRPRQRRSLGITLACNVGVGLGLGIGLTLSSACGHLPFRSAPDPSAIDGTYFTSHEVEVNVPPIVTRTVSDCLRIRSSGPGKVEFELLLVWENDHSCEVSGEARWAAGAFEFRPPPDARGVEPTCKLRLQPTRTSIIVDDSAVGVGCRSHYCGVRALLHGAFSRQARAPSHRPCPEAPMGFLDYYETVERLLRDLDSPGAE